MKLSQFIVFAALFTCSFPAAGYSLPLDDAAAVRPAFVLGDTDARSYDGPNANVIKPFDSLSGASFLSFGSVNDNTNAGVKYDFYMIAEVNFYDGNNLPGSANKFGYLDSGNSFHTVLDGNTVNPGTGIAASLTTNPGDQITFAMFTAEGDLFSTVDTNNADGGTYIIGKQVTVGGPVTLPSTFNLANLTFNVMIGDIIIFFEDKHSPTDTDYNDMVLVVRQTAVPEPTSMLLLAGGLGGLAAKRKRLKA